MPDENEVPQMIPSSFFLRFFEKAKARMDDHPRCSLKLVNEDEKGFPISLEKHRELLLEEQRLVLKDEVETRQCEEGLSSLTIGFAQDCLRELGSKNVSHISFDENQEKEAASLFQAMEDMNEAARLAFARAVLKGEVMWVNYVVKETGMKKLEDIYADRNLQEEGSMEDSRIMEFCSLSKAAVKIPSVIQFLRDGADIFSLFKDDKDNSNQSQLDTADSDNTSPVKINERLQSLHNVYFCTLGFNPFFAHSELTRIMMRFMSNPTNEDENSALYHTLKTFATSMQLACTKAFSPLQNDGVSRVVSVTHSEKIIGPNTTTESGEAPRGHSIHEEEVFKQQSEMAKKAASLQQSILSSFQKLSKEEQELELAKAKKVHDEYISKAMKIPPGPERLTFLTSVDQDTQRLLILHKIGIRQN